MSLYLQAQSPRWGHLSQAVLAHPTFLCIPGCLSSCPGCVLGTRDRNSLTTAPCPMGTRWPRQRDRPQVGSPEVPWEAFPACRKKVLCPLRGEGSLLADQPSGPFRCERGPWAHRDGRSEVRTAVQLSQIRPKDLEFLLLGGATRWVHCGEGGDRCDMPTEGQQ